MDRMRVSRVSPRVLMAIIGITASASTTAADADTADRVVFKTATLDAYEAIGFSPLAESIPFFMLGDFGGAPGSLHHGGDLTWKYQVAERMGEWAAVLQPWFVVGVGDNFYDVGVETAQDPAWDAQFESVYSADSLLRIPWLMCLGNHDYAGRPEAQMERTGNDTHGRWYMPSRSYSRVFTHGPFSVEVFSVDTNVISYTLTAETAGSCSFADPVPGCSPHFEKEQLRALADLERGLNASTADWKIVAGHHPLFSVGHHGSAGETAPLRSSLLPLFGRYGVDLYSCGHDHIAQHIVPFHRRPKGSIHDADASSAEAAVVMNGRRKPGRKIPAKQPTDHVTIGTSGPMVMPGEFDFHFERGDLNVIAGEMDDDSAADPTRHEGEELSTEQRGSEYEARGVWSSGEGEGERLREGQARATFDEFELWYSTKRRAFLVVEATQHCLRVSLVGSDGEVLHAFTRKR